MDADRSAKEPTEPPPNRAVYTVKFPVTARISQAVTYLIDVGGVEKVRAEFSGFSETKHTNPKGQRGN
jgi:hypothetical protein